MRVCQCQCKLVANTEATTSDISHLPVFSSLHINNVLCLLRVFLKILVSNTEKQKMTFILYKKHFSESYVRSKMIYLYRFFDNVHSMCTYLHKHTSVYTYISICAVHTCSDRNVDFWGSLACVLGSLWVLLFSS